MSRNYRVSKQRSRVQIDKSCVLDGHTRRNCQMLAFQMPNRFPAASCLPVLVDEHGAPVAIARPLTMTSLTVSVDPSKVSRDEAGCKDITTSRTHPCLGSCLLRQHQPGLTALQRGCGLHKSPSSMLMCHLHGPIKHIKDTMA